MSVGRMELGTGSRTELQKNAARIEEAWATSDGKSRYVLTIEDVSGNGEECTLIGVHASEVDDEDLVAAAA